MVVIVEVVGVLVVVDVVVVAAAVDNDINGVVVVVVSRSCRELHRSVEQQVNCVLRVWT